MGYRNYDTANGLVVDKTGNGDFTTIAAALTAATSGFTIFIRPGTYTENLTLKAGVNLCAFSTDSESGTVTINGKCTATFSGTCNISNIQLQTNSDYFLEVTGSNATVIYLFYCYINCLNNTGLHFTASNTSAGIIFWTCNGNIGTTGISLFTATSTGTIYFLYNNLSNTGNSTTASTAAATTVQAQYSIFGNVFSFTTTGVGNFYYCTFSYGAVINTTAITTAGTGVHVVFQSLVQAGTASAISVGTGTSMAVYNSIIQSTNTNALTGAGTLVVSGNTYSGTSHQTNVTTQTGGAIAGLTQGTAPSAGYLGENITGTASAVATTSTTPKTITSISLTPGIWDVTGMSVSVATGGTGLMQAGTLSVSATNNTQGAAQAITSGTFSIVGLTTLPIRATLSATTTYYLVVTNVYSSTTCPTTGYMSATRVG